MGVEDVVIIGAGPAGLACAWRLALAGESPLVLEASAFPRDKVCGDALSGKVTAVLRRLGGEELIRRMATQAFMQVASALSFINDRGDQVRLEIPPGEMGFTARRYAWDTWLWQQAPASIRLRSHSPVLRLERGTHSWNLYLASGERISARYIVGADGVASKVRPWVYVYRRAARPPVYAAVRLYASHPTEAGLLHLYYVPPYLPGYWWAFSMADGLTNIGVGGPPSVARRHSFRSDLRQRLDLAPNTPIAGHGIPIYKGRPPLTAPGCALVGDAGHLVDPFTGEGIGNALLSGYRLAEALLLQEPARLFTWDARLLYEQRLHKELQTEMTVSAWLHRLCHSSTTVRWLLRRLSRRPDMQKALEMMLFQPTERTKLRSPRFYWQLLGF